MIVREGSSEQAVSEEGALGHCRRTQSEQRKESERESGKARKTGQEDETHGLSYTDLVWVDSVLCIAIGCP